MFASPTQLPPSRLDRLRELTNELTHEETELYLFFKLSPDLFCIADANGYFRRVNESWTRVLGWTEDELLEHTFFDYIHKDDIKRTKEIMGHMADQNIIRFHNRYMSKTNGYVTLEWSATQWRNGLTYAVARQLPASCLTCPEYKERSETLLSPAKPNRPTFG